MNVTFQNLCLMILGILYNTNRPSTFLGIYLQKLSGKIPYGIGYILCLVFYNRDLLF